MCGPRSDCSIGAVCSGSMLFASVLNLSVMLGNYLQQMTSADDTFRCIFFLELYGLKTLKLFLIFFQDCPERLFEFSTPISYVLKWLIETVLLDTHNICFGEK